MVPTTVENARYAERIFLPSLVPHPFLLVDLDGETVAIGTDQRLAHYGVVTFFPLPEYGGLDRIEKYKVVVTLDPGTPEEYTTEVQEATTDPRVHDLLTRFSRDVNDGDFGPGTSVDIPKV
jgi:hypothetical protein